MIASEAIPAGMPAFGVAISMPPYTGQTSVNLDNAMMHHGSQFH